MKKIVLMILCVLFGMCTFLSGCGVSNSGEEADSSTQDDFNALADCHFENGFNLTSQSSFNPAPIRLDYNGTAKGLPLWRMSQWGILSETRKDYNKDLHNMQLGVEHEEGDFYVYATQAGSKEAKINRTTGEIELWVNAKKEYGTVPRYQNEDWPHLYIEQPIGEAFYLDQLESCELEMEFELLRNEGSDLNKPDSTAQFSWIFDLKSLDSSAHKDYMWFNLTILDDRYDFTPGVEMQDGGKADATKKFIFAPKGKEFLGDQLVEVGKRIHIKFDVLPYFIHAVHSAQERGYMPGIDFENIGLGGTFIGWEVPGLYDVGVRVYSCAIRPIVKE